MLKLTALAVQVLIIPCIGVAQKGGDHDFNYGLGIGFCWNTVSGDRVYDVGQVVAGPIQNLDLSILGSTEQNSFSFAYRAEVRRRLSSSCALLSGIEVVTRRTLSSGANDVQYYNGIPIDPMLRTLTVDRIRTEIPLLFQFRTGVVFIRAGGTWEVWNANRRTKVFKDGTVLDFRSSRRNLPGRAIPRISLAYAPQILKNRRLCLSMDVDYRTSEPSDAQHVDLRFSLSYFMREVK